jgi:hypothetical protein
MDLFTVTITIKDKGGEEGVDINAKIDPAPLPEEMEESEAISLLHDFMEMLQGGGEVMSAQAKLVHKDGTVLHESNLIQ